MKEKLTSFFRKFSLIHRFAKNFYWKTLGFKAKILGTKGEEKKWGKRHLGLGSDWGEEEKDWVKSYWDFRNHPHRQILVEKISQYSPSTILEIGSNCGPNLYLLSQKFPKAKMVGIDINEEAVKIGNKLFAESGVSNVKLLVNKADELEQFSNKSFDIVFTDALLMYIGSDKIENILKEILRIVKKSSSFA